MHPAIRRLNLIMGYSCSPGRQRGMIAKFPGSVVFCAEADKNPSHLFRVLTGERKSASLVEKYATWLRQRKIPWPAEAVVKPKGRAA
jgi:hypothetical protein